jgi:hypothetical protein
LLLSVIPLGLCKGRAGDTPGCPFRPGPPSVLAIYPGVIRTELKPEEIP